MNKYLPLILVLIFLLITAFLLYRKERPEVPIFFQSERVSLTVREETDKLFLDIEGYFYMVNDNPKDIVLPITFPFPNDIGPVLPESIEVIRFKSKDNIDWNDREAYELINHMLVPVASSFMYQYRFPAAGTSVMGCRYTHELESNEIGYVVTTVQSWDRALDDAYFEIILPEEFMLVDSNYEFYGIDQDESRRTNVYRARLMDFYPSEDIRGLIGRVEDSVENLGDYY